MTEAEYLKTLDDIGKVVRDAWVSWALEQENPPQRWLDPWEKLPDNIKQADIRIGQAVAVHGLTPLNRRRQELIHKKNHEGGLTKKEGIILEELQEIHGKCIDLIHPRSPLPEFSDHIKTLIKEMENEEKS